MFRYTDNTEIKNSFPKNNENSLPLRDFSTLLKQQGYVTLGNPYIKVTPNKNGNSFKLGLLTKTSSTQIELCSGDIHIPPSSQLSVVERLFEALNTTQTMELDQFIKETHGARVYNYQFSFSIDHLRKRLSQISKTKCLTFGIATKILSKDSIENNHSQDETKQDLHKLLQHHNAAHNPEQLTYLARISALPVEDRQEMLIMPLKFLVEAFGIPAGYKSITLPEENPSGFIRQEFNK